MVGVLCRYDEDGDCKQSVSDLCMIDHILVSSGLAEKVVSAYIYHGYTEYCGTLNSGEASTTPRTV
jgi:hypothetical protein